MTTKATTPATASATTKATTKATKPSPKETTMPTLPAEELKSIATAKDNAATDVQRNFVAWLEQAGVEGVDIESVKLAFSLRHVFQKSETNQNHLADRRNGAEAKLQARAEAAAERAKKAMEKAEELKAKAAAKK